MTEEQPNQELENQSLAQLIEERCRALLNRIDQRGTTPGEIRDLSQAVRQLAAAKAELTTGTSPGTSSILGTLNRALGDGLLNLNQNQSKK